VALLVWAGAGLCGADIPRPEHPRPDVERSAWLSLNGEWQFEIDEAGDGETRGLTVGHDLSQRITVPFCPESALSGIGNTAHMTHVWYRRLFQVPPAMQGQRLRLNFGAVDWHTRVWLNGQFLGEHRGGYVPFAFEVTGTVRDGDNDLVVHVRDDVRSGLQAAGKQSHGKSEGCVYTRTTGIWQTVWLEAVGSTYLREFALTPDLAGGRVLFQGDVDGPRQGVSLCLRATAAGQPVGEETVPASGRSTTAVVALARLVPWEPGKPFLYDLSIETRRGDTVLDTVRTSFGLRQISIEGNRFLINGKPVFQRLVLDQGFYPDGIYTAPTDEALRRDIELSMAAGFNGARLHQKVFEPRFLYWADRLGYLVWGEYPSWGVNIDHKDAVRDVVEEWREVLRRDRNHPAIIGWCPLNETGRDEPAARLQSLLAFTRTLDPTRPFLDTSGYTHFLPETDVYDTHDYCQDPGQFAARYGLFGLTGSEPWNNQPADPRSRYRGQPFLISEYGGMHVKTDRDTGPAWGYDGAGLPVADFLARYQGLTDVLLDNPNMFGFCYTQLTDIEQEQNGVYFYDRTPKYDPARLRAINARAAAYETQPPRVRPLAWRTVVPTSQTEAQEWRYTLTPPAENWYKPGFEPAAWETGKGGFGIASTPGAVVGTEWKSPEIWIRRTFQVERTGAACVALKIHHDEDAEVYVNGQAVATLSGYATDYVLVPCDALGKALTAGENVLAVHCRQTAGGQFIDVGIEAAVEVPGPTAQGSAAR